MSPFVVALVLAAAAPVETAEKKAESADSATVEDARQRVENVVGILAQTRKVFDLLHLVPSYECGEARHTAVEKLVGKITKELPCAVVTTEPAESFDLVRVRLAEKGCQFGKSTLTGEAVFRISGGKEHLGIELDLGALALDGTMAATTAGYDVCGDVKAVRVRTNGRLEKAARDYQVDLAIGYLPGLPIIGSSSLRLSGEVNSATAGEQERIQLAEIDYVPGELLPRTGTVEITSSGGRRIRTTFLKKFWRLGQAEIVIGDHKPVRVPIVR